MQYIIWVVASAAITGFCSETETKYSWLWMPAMLSTILGMVCWMIDVAQSVVIL